MADDDVRQDYYIRVYADPPYKDYIINAESLDDAMAAASLEFHEGYDENIVVDIPPSKQESPERFRA